MIGSAFRQAVEKARPRRSRIVQTLNVPQGYASGLHSLRPSGTVFLNRLGAARVVQDFLHHCILPGPQWYVASCATVTDLR
jgi:hypothetical protein